MGLSRVGELLGRSTVNGDMRWDWRDVESSYGRSLPAEYKEFVSAYGPGELCGSLYVFHPRATGGDEGLNLGDLWDSVARTYPVLAEQNPDLYPYVVHPAAGGLVAVARSMSGNVVFLVPPDAPDIGTGTWGVAVEMGGWIVLRMSFGAFLVSALEGELEIPLLDGEPSFVPVGRVG